MVTGVLSRIVLLLVGILYPAYASHKAVKTKNVKEYVRWMIYWIVFALFLFVEIFADIFVAFWLPFYYELKILLILWLTSPATKGSNFIYKKFINPQLNQYEQVIDSYIESLWNAGYQFIRRFATQATDYIFEIMLDMLRKGHVKLATFLPHVNQIAQENAVIEKPRSNSTYEANTEPEVESEQEGESSHQQPNVRHRSQSHERDESVEASGDSDSTFEELSCSAKDRPLVLEKKKGSKSGGRGKKKVNRQTR